MERRTTNGRAATASALTLLLALTALLAACGKGAQGNANGAGAQAGSPQPGANGAGASDTAKLAAEIERLEKQAERNPADAETRDQLARAYVSRGNAQRSAGQLREAIADYQRALRLDPDNAEAQNNAAAATAQLGGEQEGENGEPAPLPITPNVADEDEKPAAAAPPPATTPTQTPKKNDK